jgi:hypothetical protein
LFKEHLHQGQLFDFIPSALPFKTIEIAAFSGDAILASLHI